MKLFSWITGRFSQRHKAMWLYRRGMIKAKLHDHASAVADYTAVIEMASAPANVRAMALYNRSLVHSAIDNDSDAIGDLQKLLEMEGAAGRVLTEARRKLARIRRSSQQLEERPANGET
jgi:hypothetical protein